MNMEVRTIMELIQVFAAYTACVFLTPYIVFHHFLYKKCMAEKFILCTLIGNFYIINVVFLIFLLHIPGKMTLYLATILPAFIAWRQINQPQIKKFFIFLYNSISRLFLGEAKIRTIWTLLSQQPKKWVGKTIRAIFSHALHHTLEWIMLLGFLGFNIWYYGYHVITRYSYGAPDLTVHHYWINEMDNGTIFCNGVYPFGFHNVIYFLHTFFGIDTVAIMKVFGIIQTLYIYLMLYILLRLLCRSRYVPMLGVFLYTLPDIYNFQTTMRYQNSLPQEFGMLFLYPCAYFLIQFFERKKQEIKTERELRRQRKFYTWLEQYHILPSTRSLIFFAMSFSMTFAAHFYITIIAVFLCLAVAIAYFPTVMHPRYFWAIALAGILSLTSAVAPMGIAYIQGTPLQGSLEWALGVMSPNSSSQETSEEDIEETEQSDSQKPFDTASNTADNNSKTPNRTTSQELSSGETTKEPGMWEKISSKLQQVPTLLKSYSQRLYMAFKIFNDKTRIFLCNVCNGYTITSTVVWAMEGLFVFSLIGIIIRRKAYYRNLLFVSLYTLFMILLCCAQVLNLPSLMELSRASIFMAYAIPLLGALTLDAILVFAYRHQPRVKEFLPIVLTISLVFLTVANNYVKPLNMIYATQASGEVHCNYEIMENYPDKNWTVVTTTNSLQIIRNKGWHLELSSFLKEMENYTSNTNITIPTKYVFFYIEKKPIAFGYTDYVTNAIANTGYVSTEAAAEKASYEGGDVYSAPNRHILESKFFYWAKAFQQKYPQEFQVYYEDDSFICYRIIQNEYNLYNFAINYGYNK